MVQLRRSCQESKGSNSRALRDPASVRTLFGTANGRAVEELRLNIPRSASCEIRDVQPRWSSSMKIVGMLGILLLCLGLACSRKSSHEPVTVTFLDVEWEAPDKLPKLAQDLQDFTRETGIQVKRLPRPDGSLNQLALWRELLQKGAATPDVCSIDVIWSGILNQYLMDLKPYFATELSSQDPVVVASYTVGDKLVAIPHHAYVGVLFYRTDLLRQYGYREPPKTWDELQMMATRIQAGERAKGEKDFWGYVWQGAADEDLTCSGLEWQMSDGGGRIIEDDQTISVNNPQAIRAWQRAARWVGSISPSGVIAHAKWDAQQAWNSGKVAFFRGWASDYSLITLREPPGNATQYGVTSVPGARAGRASTLGGNGFLGDEALTAREIEVLQHIASGNRNREIAERLFISEETVKGHIKHIMEKLGAADRTQAVSIAVRRGIIQL
jgi:trehalose/maltose transport system substrate-binding protein